jgi:hypothetical protein
MKQSEIPTRFPIPFANSAAASLVRPVPRDHQAASLTDAPASLEDGFPIETFTPLASGGVPPNGADMNGILKQITAWLRWAAAGAPQPFNADFCAAIGGYPKGATLSSPNPGVFWTSSVDDNTTDPNAPGAANWWMDDRVVSQSPTFANGYRSFASGYKECWGRAIVGAGNSTFVTVPVTHTEFIIPTIAADIADIPGSANMVGTAPVALTGFVLRNWANTDMSVNWRTVGR